MNSKYLKYALGEIVLVVIGILIALSINTWNEKRKDHTIEEQIISEMLTSLKSDRSRFRFLQHRIDQKDSAIQILYQLKESGNKPDDEQIGTLLGMAGQGISLSYDIGPYQALVALGINKMSNKDLLKDIIYYYNVRLPRGDQFIIEAHEEFEPRSRTIMKEAFDSGLLANEVVKNSEGRWTSVWNNKTEEILSSNYFKEYTVAHLAYAELLYARMRPIILNNETLIKKLENY